MFCKKFSKGFYEQLRPQIESVGFYLSKDQEIELSREIVIINLWIISKAFADGQAKGPPDLFRLAILPHELYNLTM